MFYRIPKILKRNTSIGMCLIIRIAIIIGAKKIRIKRSKYIIVYLLILLELE